MTSRILHEMGEIDGGVPLIVKCCGNRKDGAILLYASHKQENLIRDLVSLFDGHFDRSDQALCCGFKFDTTSLPEEEKYALLAHVTRRRMFLFGPQPMIDLLALLAYSLDVPTLEADESRGTIGFWIDGEFTPNHDPSNN